MSDPQPAPEALAIIERVYGIALNPNEDYYGQLKESFDASGNLSNRVHTTDVLFSLCQLVDRYEKRIKTLERSLGLIVERQTKATAKKAAPALDPTAPLPDVPETTTKPDPNNAV